MDTHTQSGNTETALNDIRLQAPALRMDADALLEDFAHYFGRMQGCQVSQQQPYLFEALVYATRVRLMERWTQTNKALQRGHSRRAYYLSLEFLIGRLLRNALLSLDIQASARDAMEQVGVTLETLYEQEQDAGLGNGGLGRLAACFLDSCATLRLPVMGYGIRYHYGMFRQHFENGRQVEKPDTWLHGGFPWEIKRIELSRIVKFGGRCLSRVDEDGRTRHSWVETHDVLAIPFDVPIPGYQNDVVNTLRLWSAAATDEFDLNEFNAGSYADAVAAKNAAENITLVLYPNNESENGQELRLRQQYFLASASLQDVLSDWLANNGNNFDDFAANNCFHLNDTHPAIAVPELMRLLMDEHGMHWNTAWHITRKTMAYTNHTLLPEALELWSQAMIARLLPRIMEIIHEINRRFMIEVSERWTGDEQRWVRMSLIQSEQSGQPPMVRMAYLAIVGSYSVNGVAELHSRLLRQGMLKDFAEHWPEKFNNKTNGVTQRRWLASCNPGLSMLISDSIGGDWITDLEQLARLQDFVTDSDFNVQWRSVRNANKTRLAHVIEQRTGLAVDTAMLFDVQVKRIHEYKRQLLNLLHVVHLYDRISRGYDGLVPRLVIIGGKAAPGYVMAKNIIKCINNVAAVINAEPAMQGRLQLIFYPDYNVSAMELICPATDLSEQISTAGKEASGTGNMKFMMNGALTIGTLDGANVEILDAVGARNFFLFGLTVDDIVQLGCDYNPQAIIDGDEDFLRVIQLLESGHFNRTEPGVFDAVLQALRNPADPWMTSADFRSFIDTQTLVGEAFKDVPRWTQTSIRNTAASGRFSTDRTIRDYNRDIWRLDPIRFE